MCFFFFAAFVLEQTNVESTNLSKISFAKETTKLRHSVSLTSPKSVHTNFDETSQLRKEQSTINRRRRTSVFDTSVIDLCCEYTGLPNVPTFDRDLLDARSTVLRRCGQAEPLCFADIYSQRYVQSFVCPIDIQQLYP